MRDIRIFESKESLFEEAASEIQKIALEAVQKGDWFNIALAGGSTPAGLYQKLATDPYAVNIPWQKTRVFWGDERCVPANHPDSNFRMSYETLLSKVAIPKENIFPIRGELSPEKAASEFAEDLYQAFNLNFPFFDLILLGVGQDGHTASLFPEAETLKEKDKLAVVAFAKALGSYRISLTLPVLNKARRIFFLVTGRNKASIIQEILTRPREASPYPAALVASEKGGITWFLDQEAAQEIH